MADQEQIVISRAELSDQGRLGPLLLEVYGPVLSREFAAAAAAGIPGSTVEDELMAADDFYFSTIDLMDCCFLARSGDVVIGAACINPYVGELHYVAVLPAWRRRGIAKTLVDLAVKEMYKRGLDHLRVDVSLALVDSGGLHFLSSLGFHEIRKSLVMGKKL